MPAASLIVKALGILPIRAERNLLLSSLGWRIAALPCCQAGAQRVSQPPTPKAKTLSVIRVNVWEPGGFQQIRHQASGSKAPRRMATAALKSLADPSTLKPWPGS